MFPFQNSFFMMNAPLPFVFYGYDVNRPQFNFCQIQQEIPTMTSRHQAEAVLPQYDLLIPVQNMVEVKIERDVTPLPVEQPAEPQEASEEPKRQLPQKYGRNICSNIFHSIIRLILYDKIYEKFIMKIIQNHRMGITMEEFYTKLYFKQNKLKEYVPYPKIFQFYLGNGNKIKEGLKRHNQFCKILRIVSRKYLLETHSMAIYDSPKLKRDSKCFHIRQGRKMLNIVKGIDKKEKKQRK